MDKGITFMYNNSIMGFVARFYLLAFTYTYTLMLDPKIQIRLKNRKSAY